jgi:hypothetical protein
LESHVLSDKAFLYRDLLGEILKETSTKNEVFLFSEARGANEELFEGALDEIKAQCEERRSKQQETEKGLRSVIEA